jgi:hypothetical protein
MKEGFIFRVEIDSSDRLHVKPEFEKFIIILLWSIRRPPAGVISRIPINAVGAIPHSISFLILRRQGETPPLSKPLITIP